VCVCVRVVRVVRGWEVCADVCVCCERVCVCVVWVLCVFVFSVTLCERSVVWLLDLFDCTLLVV